MYLTKYGERVAHMELRSRRMYCENLLAGRASIEAFVVNAVCYDAVAFACYLNSDAIRDDELRAITAQAWCPIFNFPGGAPWRGDRDFEKGQAVGFYRQVDSRVFHAAVATGRGARVRSVNGHTLGHGWRHEVDVRAVLGLPDRDGAFTFDGTKINVFLSAGHLPPLSPRTIRSIGSPVARLEHDSIIRGQKFIARF